MKLDYSINLTNFVLQPKPISDDYLVFSYSRILVLSILMVLCVSLNAQETCGAEYVPDSVYAKYASSLAKHAAKPEYKQGGNKSNEEFRIPIHLYIAESPAGSLPLGFDRASTEALFITSLQFVNEQMASHNVEFYIVKSDVIPFTQTLFKQSNPTITRNYVEDNFPNQHDDNAFRIYLTEVNGAFGEYPHGVVIGGGNTNARWLMHEIGHFFGLLHTFQHSWRNSNVWLFPDGSPTNVYGNNFSTHVIHSAEFCVDGSVGQCYGDYISSTPPDLQDRFCSQLDEAIFNASQDCEVNGNMYDFDFFNVMSYWRPSSTRLLPEQKQRIYDVIADDDFGVAPFGGDMSHLTDANEPVVDYTPPNFAYLRQTGFVDLVRTFQNDTIDFVPFFQGKIRTRYSGPLTIAQHGRPYIGDGIFKMNRFIPINEPNTNVRFRFDSLSHECEALPIYSTDYLDVSDVLAIQRYILGLTFDLNSYQKIAADVNNDGKVRTSDLVAIIRRILDVDHSFVVPDYRFVPKYSLTDAFAFNSEFMANPFTATWEYNGATYSYITTETSESYLGIEETPGGTSNLQSFALSLTDTNVLKPVAVSFNAVRSGDVNMEEDLIGQNICGTTMEEQLYDGNVMLQAGVKNTIRIDFSKSDGFKGMVGSLSIPASESAHFTELYKTQLSNGGDEYEIKSSSVVSEFGGLVISDAKEIKFLVLAPDNQQKTNYIEFSIEGLSKGKKLSDVLSISCADTKVYLEEVKPEGKSHGLAGQKSSNADFLNVAVSTENTPDQTEELHLFPNPVKETLFIRSPKGLSGQSSGAVVAKIYDVAGRTASVQSLSSAGSVLRVPVTQLERGVYILSLAFDGAVRNVRFVKK